MARTADGQYTAGSKKPPKPGLRGRKKRSPLAALFRSLKYFQPGYWVYRAIEGHEPVQQKTPRGLFAVLYGIAGITSVFQRWFK